MCIAMRVTILVVAIILAFSATLKTSSADRGVGSIELSANPTAVIADGKSVCTVTARARDRTGKFVPDGTDIRFSASLGVIEEIGTTSAGVARVKLVSVDVTGTCIVTASWIEGQAVGQTNVEFCESLVGAGGPEYIGVDADDYLAYSIDYKVLEALGNVKVSYRSLELTAHEVQIDLEKSRVVARGKGTEHTVKVQTVGGVIEGSVFTCDLLGLRGMLLSAERGDVRQIDLSKAVQEIGGSETSYMPEDFDFADLSESAILVKASRATIFPNEKIHFKKANVYVDGKRMLSLPLYVLSLTGYPVEGEQYVGYSTGGLTLNLPFYYSLTPSSSGTLMIRHGDSTGWGQYGQKPGWYVNMQQKYAAERCQGAFMLSQVTGGEWGAQFVHSQDLGKRTQGYLYVDYPAHRDLFGNLNLNRSYDAFSVGLNLYGSKYRQQGQHSDSLSGDIYMQTRPKPVGNSPFRYTLSARSAYSVMSTDLQAGETKNRSSSQSFRGNVYSAPVPLGRDLSLRGSVGLGYIWSGSNSSGLSSLGTMMLDWRVSRYSSVQLSYRYADRASIYASSMGKQALSATCILSDGKRLRASIYGTKGLDYSTANLFTDVSYRLDPRWRFGVRSSLSNFGESSYNDLELALGRAVGTRELIAVWSQSQKRIMFELGAAGL